MTNPPVFQAIRKGKGRVHLAVRMEPVVETFCGKRFALDEITRVELEADCQSCRRRLADPGRVSSAYFEDGRGGALLELSLQQARERRREPSDLPARPATPVASRAPHLRIVPSERPEPSPQRSAPEAAPPRQAERLERPRPAAIELPPGIYRTPHGVVVKVGGGNQKPRLERRQGDRVRVIAADVELDIPPAE